MMSVHLRHANLTLHNTASSVVKPNAKEDKQIYAADANDDDIAIALQCGFWAYANLFRVVLSGEERTRFEGFYAERMPSFFRS
jgi:hypothetical protein